MTTARDLWVTDEPMLPSIAALTDEEAQKQLHLLRFRLFSIVNVNYRDNFQPDERRSINRRVFGVDSSGTRTLEANTPYGTTSQFTVTASLPKLTYTGTLGHNEISSALPERVASNLSRGHRPFYGTVLEYATPVAGTVNAEEIKVEIASPTLDTLPADEHPKQAYSDLCRSLLLVAEHFQATHGWCTMARDVFATLNVPADVFGEKPSEVTAGEENGYTEFTFTARVRLPEAGTLDADRIGEVMDAYVGSTFHPPSSVIRLWEGSNFAHPRPEGSRWFSFFNPDSPDTDVVHSLTGHWNVSVHPATDSTDSTTEGQ